jgi:GT2 family glycosyltransferase
MADVSVVIVNHNTRELLRSCLASLLERGGVSDLEVIVVDNASTDGSLEMVREEFPPVTVLANSTNEGFAAPNNRGMALANGQYIFLLNTDTLLHQDALRVLVRALEQDPSAGACGPMLVHPDGSVQRSVRGFPTLTTHCADMFFLDRLFPRSRLFGSGEQAAFDYSRKAEVDHVMAAAFLVRREVLSSAGVFDERFSIYYNDMDWCLRMRNQGWKILYVPEARITHYGGATTTIINKNFAYFRELHENVELYYRKHFGRCGLLVYRIFLVLGFLLRTAGWGLVRLVRPSERSRHMFAFSWRTLLHAFGLPTPETPTSRHPSPVTGGSHRD